MRPAHHNGGRFRAALVCFLLAASGVAAAPAQPSVTLSFVGWHDADEPPTHGLTDLIEGFHDRNPGIRLNANREDREQARVRLRYWFGSHSQYAPDLTLLPDVWLSAYADRLLPLDDVLKPKDLAGFVPAVLDRCRVGGHLVGLPWRVTSRALYYRSDLLAAAKLKPPRTLDELKAVATALSHPPDVYGVGLPAAPGGAGLPFFLDLLSAHGGSPLDKDGRLQLQTPPAEAALAFCVALHQAGALQPEVLTWTEQELAEAFGRGRLALAVGGPALGGRLRKAQVKFGVVPLPSTGDPALPVAVEVLVALKATRQAEAVGKFLRFMATDEAQRALTFMGSLPAGRSQYERVRDDDDVGPFVAGLDRARGVPLAESEAAQRIVDRALWLCLSGRATPAEALKMASAEEADRIL